MADFNIQAAFSAEEYASAGDFSKVLVRRFTGYPVKRYDRLMIDYSDMTHPD